jgi:glutathione-specific gamma-glutamylcyclotransferase
LPDPTIPMRLTPELAACVPQYDGRPLGPGADRIRATVDDDAAVLARLMADRPGDGQVWIFAYGSLIWNPNFTHDEDRIATAHGWHRSFSLGWMTFFRGCPDRPGLMLAMDRGGSCKGVAFRLNAARLAEDLPAIIRREMPFRNSAIPARWITVRTAQGPLRAVAFPIDRASDAYVGRLPDQVVAASLATSAGEAGTMAEYLQSTVAHLEDRGIHDAYLWRMQDMVARRIEAATGSGRII